MMAEQETRDELAAITDDATVREVRRLAFDRLKESLKTQREGEKQEGELDPKTVSLIPLLAGVTWEKGLDGAPLNHSNARLAYEQAGDDPRAARAIAKFYKLGLGDVDQSDDAAAIWHNLADHLVQLQKLRAGVRAIGTDELEKYISNPDRIVYYPFVAIDPDIKAAVVDLISYTKRLKKLSLSKAQAEALATELGETFTTALLEYARQLPDHPPIDPITGHPQYYADRPKDPETGRLESIDKFIERVWYDPWIKEGVLSRADLRRIDSHAASALDAWIGYNKDKQSLPFHFPTKSEVLVQQPPSPERVREARRVLKWVERHGAETGSRRIGSRHSDRDDSI